MKNKQIIAGWMFLIVVLSSCASSYHSIAPQQLYYNIKEASDEITFSYRYNILQEKGNKKYAKKETAKGINVVAVKITNHTDRHLNFRDDIQLMAGSQYVYPLETGFLHQQLKQNTPIYLLYLLMAPIRFYSAQADGSVSSFPIGLIMGPGISIVNMATAGTANTNFKTELDNNNLADRIIAPGETVYGLVGLRNTGYAPLKAIVVPSDLKKTPF